MSLPTWAIGEDLENPGAPESYVVHLGSPLFVALVTQKSGGKLMLTLGPGIPPWERIEATGLASAWFNRLHDAARFWAAQVQDPSYSLDAPEILSRGDFQPPRLLLCDNAELNRVFLVHTREPFFAAEAHDGHWHPVTGDTRHPSVALILAQQAAP